MNILRQNGIRGMKIVEESQKNGFDLEKVNATNTFPRCRK